MDIHDIHPKTRQHSKTVRHCIGNILELEVKEDLLALFLQIGNNGRAFTVKKLHPYFIKCNRITQFLNKGPRLLSRRKIKGHNQTVLYLRHFLLLLTDWAGPCQQGPEYF